MRRTRKLVDPGVAYPAGVITRKGLEPGIYRANADKLVRVADAFVQAGAAAMVQPVGARKSSARWPRERRRLMVDGLAVDVWLVLNIERTIGPCTWARTVDPVGATPGGILAWCAVGFQRGKRVAMVAPLWPGKPVQKDGAA